MKRAFTLTELLIVCSLIATLIALTAAATRQVKQYAVKVVKKSTAIPWSYDPTY